VLRSADRDPEARSPSVAAQNSARARCAAFHFPEISHLYLFLAGLQSAMSSANALMAFRFLKIL